MTDKRLPSPKVLAAKRILVVGDVMLDRYWHGDVERVSPEAPVPVVLVRREDNRLGGAANVARNVKSLGAQVTLLSVVGADDGGREIRTMLDADGIRSELIVSPEMETIVKLRVISRAQQMLRLDFEKLIGQSLLGLIGDRFSALLPDHDIVIFSDYGKGALVHIRQMIAMSKEAGKLTLIDPKGDDWGRYFGASVITPNRAELSKIIGWWDSDEALYQRVSELLIRLRVGAVLLTRSEEGMTLISGDCLTTIPAIAREVSDVTGAGDTVIATLASMLACGVGIKDAMIISNRAAGLVVGKFGTATVSYGELLE